MTHYLIMYFHVVFFPRRNKRCIQIVFKYNLMMTRSTSVTTHIITVNLAELGMNTGLKK